MAVQTQLASFQNGTHLFFSPLSVRQRSWQKAQRKWSVLLDSPDGDAQDSRSFGGILCFYLGTFRPLLLCLASPKAEEAIKPTARYKHSGGPEWCVLKTNLHLGSVLLLEKNPARTTFFSIYLILCFLKTQKELSNEKQNKKNNKNKSLLHVVTNKYQRVATLFHSTPTLYSFLLTTLHMAKQLYNILRVQQKFSHLFNNLPVCVVPPRVTFMLGRSKKSGGHLVDFWMWL